MKRRTAESIIETVIDTVTAAAVVFCIHGAVGTLYRLTAFG